jgi:hypothetical protein
MSQYYNDHEIQEILFEDLPSDDESISSIDNTDDDETYIPEPNNDNILVFESDSDSEEDVEILNIEENITYILPSPQKTRSSCRKKKQNNVTPNINNNRRTLFLSNENIERTQYEELALPLTENITREHEEQSPQIDSNIQSQFIQPIWSSNENINTTVGPFGCLEGPTNIVETLSEITPFSVFKLLMTDEIITYITFHTNLYANQKYMRIGKAYSETNINEINAFLGLNILMGIKKQCSYRDFWSSAPDLHDDYISSIMPLNRFSWILSHFHLNDNSVIPKRGDVNFDKLYKVRPFLNLILKNSQALYNPNRVVAIDESMIKFKGRNAAKQYMPKKPIKRGYKVWALADKHGYLWNFDVYTGKSGDLAETNLGARVVKNLSAPLKNKNYFLYFDNYFTSYPLMTYLKLNGINACGTVNITRKYLPKLKEDKLLKQGEYDWRVDQFSTSIVKWKDKRSVTLLSNFHNPVDTDNVPRRAKDGTISMIPCPKVLKDYNQNMNCVDKLDQNKKSCQIDRKSKKWWHRIFFHFLDIAVVNAHVVYTQTTGNKMTMKNFRRDISRQLLNTTIINKRQLQNMVKSPTEIKKYKPSVPDYIRLEKSAHQPKLSTRRRCARCSTKKKEVRTEWICSICNIPLCITKSRNCFFDHHNNI